jgi:DNA-binding FrmR family transcriptional regulator
MQKNTQKQILNRMNYLIGHLTGIKKMVAEEKYCIDIIKQNEAVIAAIQKLNLLVLKNHLDTCVTRAIRGDSIRERKNKIQELLEIFKNYKR